LTFKTKKSRSIKNKMGKGVIKMKRGIVVLFMVLALLIVPMAPALASDTVAVTVTATGAFISISGNESAWSPGIINVNATPSTATTWCTVDNTSNIQTDNTIETDAGTWTSGGVGWTQSDDGSAGVNTVGFKANAGGTWGVSDVNFGAAPGNLLPNQAATTDWSFGLKFIAASEWTDGEENHVHISVIAAPG
jgi:hypothetical protein